MATRCNLIVEDRHNRIQIYRHWDGEPQAVLPALAQALAYAWPLPRFEAADFAAAIVAAWKQPGGGNIYIDGNPVAWELIHPDVDYVYRIIQSPDEAPEVWVYEWAYHMNARDLQVYPPQIHHQTTLLNPTMPQEANR